MSTFGVTLLIRILIPYAFGLFLAYFGITGLMRKENIVRNITYTAFGLFYSLGMIIFLLFFSDVSMYS